MKKEDIITTVNEFIAEADYITNLSYLDDKHSYSRARKRLKDLLQGLKNEPQV